MHMGDKIRAKKVILQVIKLSPAYEKARKKLEELGTEDPANKAS